MDIHRMETLPEDEILEFRPGTLETVRKMHGLDKLGDMNNAIDVFDAWIKQQKHFVKKDYDRDYLERLIIASKGSVERAKDRLDRISSLKTLLPHYFGDYDVNKDFKCLDDRLIYVPLPKMTEKYERTTVMSLGGDNYASDIFLYAYRYVSMLVEYYKLHDYAETNRFLLDIRHTNMTEFLGKLGLVEARQFVNLITDGYGLRLKGIHLLTNSRVIDAFVMMLRQILTEKLAGRVQVHRTVESLYEIWPKEVLPKEYGGEEQPIAELYKKWGKVLSSEEYRNHWRMMAAANTDEALREKAMVNTADYMGMLGTFRTLTVD